MSQHILSSALLVYEAALARLALATVLESMPVLGRAPSRTFVASVLTGSLKKDVVDAEAYRLVTFGTLSDHRASDIVAMLDTLIGAGLLDDAPQRGLVLSGRGRALVESSPAQELQPLGILVGAVDGRRLDAAIRSGLIDALRRYRVERARGEDVPEYKIFSEATLRQIATALPGDENVLGAIAGMGPKRVAAHGAEVLRIVAEHLPVIERLVASMTEPEFAHAAG